jgi:hypothetical protein
MAETVDIFVVLRGVAQLVEGAQKSAAAITEVGDASETTGKKAAGGWKSMLKWAAGASLFYGATKFIKGSVDATAQLTKATLSLTRQTGLSTQTSSEWVSLTQERGISARQLTTSIAKLNKMIETSATGTSKSNTEIAAYRAQIDQLAQSGAPGAAKQMAALSTKIASAQASGEKARLTLQQLGVPLDSISKGNTGQVLGKIADAFQKIKDPAERSALAQQLFGRAGQQLLPILMEGSTGIDKLLAKQKEYGNYLTNDSLKANRKAIEQQRELDTALSGVKVQLGQALLPVLVTFSKMLIAVARFIRPVTSNAKALTTVIIGLTVAIVAWKVATMAAAVAAKLQVAATEEWTTAQLALNLALDANVIGLIVIAIAALVIGIVEAYKHVKWFRDFVNETWSLLKQGAEYVIDFFKHHWMEVLGLVLAGPFGLAAVEIYKHFNAIKSFALGIVAAIKHAIQDLVHWVDSLPGKIGGVLKKIPGVGLAEKALGGITSHLAAGGVVTRPGAFLVGESGPEMVALPAGSAVSPIPSSASFPRGAFGGEPLTIVVPVTVDGRELTRVVARVTADQLARR